MVNRCHALCCAVAFLLPVGLCGCGVKNPVAGQVIRDGRPVETGIVKFIPDIDKGARGPTVTLDLREGQFSSAKDGVSMVAGEHRVAVIVTPAASAEEPASEEHRFHVNVPEGGVSDLSFDVSRKPRGKGKAEDPEQDQ